MRRFLIVAAMSAMTVGVGLAQEFTTSPLVAPQPEPPRPPVEQNSNSSWFKKFVTAQNKLQLVNPAAPQQYGSGEEVVVVDPRDPKERPRFFRLFSIAF